ncbi:MAG: hypothetical protein KBG47_01970 [Bacteroidia bacterium]|nr:hypothetical protein [Bacteroidia bacterium]
MRSFSLCTLITVAICIFNFSCNNKSDPSTLNGSVDTIAVSTNSQHSNEDDNRVIETQEEYFVGKKFEVPDANKLLAIMLYYSNEFQIHDESSNSVNIKLMKYGFFPDGVPQEYTEEFATVKCGSFVEGFGGLTRALSMACGQNYNGETKALIEKLSGLNYTRITEHSQPFSYINPEVIDWCWKNFYREPRAGSMADVSLNTIYDVVFKKFIRTLVVTHNELDGSNIENEKNWYRNSIIMEKGYAVQLLNKRYELPEKYSKSEINANYYPYACGFWLRRSIDESGPVIWSYLRTIIMDYDYDWGCKNFKICDRG